MAELPQDFSALEAQITEQYPDLSRRLQQTARFLLDHPQEVAFSTVARLAGVDVDTWRARLAQSVAA